MTNEFNPDWDTQAVLVEEIQRMAKRIEELEAKYEKDGSPCPEFWDWLPKAYQNGDADDLPKFTKYNMEVAFLAGKQSAALEAKDEPVATDWERIARVQNAKLMAMLDEAGGFEKLCKVMDKYEAITPTQRTWVGLTDEEIKSLDYSGTRIEFVRAIKAALEAKDEPVVWNEGVPAMLPKQKEGETFIVSYEPKLEAKDELVAWMDASRFEELRNGFTVMTTLTKKKAFFDDVAIYTTPPQRKPLTDEEIGEVAIKSQDGISPHDDTLRFARAIEAAHGIRGEV